MTFLIDFGVKSGLAMAGAFLLTLALRKVSASVRYAMWGCALGAVLVLPLAMRVGPGWNVDRSAWHRPAPANAGSVGLEASSEVVVVRGSRPVSLPVIVWLAGAMAMLLRVAAGHWRVRSLFGRAEEIRDARWLALAEEAAAGIGFRRSVALKRTMATDVPLSYGLMRATVLLPGEAEDWTEERRRIVLAHEMIHARRLDSVWGLMAQCALAVNWFNPLAWLAVRRFRREQERSCDDAVVLSGTASTVYAAHLVDLARSIAIPEPALGMAERFDLEGRVCALLDPARRRNAVSVRMCAAIGVTALALIVPLAAVRAQTVSKPASSEASVTPVASAVAEPVKNSGDAKTVVAMSRPARRAPVRPHSTAEAAPEAAPASSAKGSVYDPSGAVVPFATISFKNTASGNEEAAVTDSGGTYKLQGIAGGEYVITVRSRGFATYQKTLSIEDGAAATMNFNLAIGGGEQAVVITAKRPEQAAAAPATSDRIRVGGMVQAFNLIRKVTPVYPADAKADGVEGTVLLRAIVSKSGSLLSITPVNTGVDQRLVSAAVSAASVWQYQPALLNGEPVEVVTTITMSFRLD